MKRFLIALVTIVIGLALGGFIFYQYYLPGVVADVLIHEETPAYVPPFMKEKLEKYRTPIRKGADEMIGQLHKADIPVADVITTIDKTSDEQIQMTFAELESTELKSSSQAFDIVKKHVPASFNIEALRKPFMENVTVDMIEYGLIKIKSIEKDQQLNPRMTREVLKEILIQKEKEYIEKQRK